MLRRSRDGSAGAEVGNRISNALVLLRVCPRHRFMKVGLFCLGTSLRGMLASWMRDMVSAAKYSVFL